MDSFLNELETTMASLGKKSQSINNSIKQALNSFEEEEAKVDEYYSHFYEIIDEHKRRVLE